MEKMLGRLFSFFSENAILLYAGIGIGFYRCALEWPVWFNNTFAEITIPPFPLTDDVFLVFDAGKVLGLILYCALCYVFDKKRNSSILLLLPSAVLACGYLAPLLSIAGAPIHSGIMLAAYVTIGAGIGMLFSQWIELCGLFPPFKVIQILAISYIVRAVLLPLLTGMTVLYSSLIVFAFVATAFIQIQFCYSKISLPDTWCRAFPERQQIQSLGSLFLCVCVFAFSYGLGESSTHLAHSTFEAGLGKLLPSVIIVFLANRLGDRFDQNLLYAISLPLMIVGLIGIQFLDMSPSLSQITISAALASFHVLAYTMVCAYAYQSKTSSMFAGACVRGLALVAADIAVCLMRFNPALFNGVFITLTIVVTLVVSMLAVVSQMRKGSDAYPYYLDEGALRKQNLDAIARSVNLSRREAMVFQLLINGQSATNISEELFISGGAVRAHCSRIYDKFGVHSRKEFEDLFSRR